MSTSEPFVSGTLVTRTSSGEELQVSYCAMRGIAVKTTMFLGDKYFILYTKGGNYYYYFTDYIDSRICAKLYYNDKLFSDLLKSAGIENPAGFSFNFATSIVALKAGVLALQYPSKWYILKVHTDGTAEAVDVTWVPKRFGWRVFRRVGFFEDGYVVLDSDNQSQGVLVSVSKDNEYVAHNRWYCNSGGPMPFESDKGVFFLGVDRAHRFWQSYEFLTGKNRFRYFDFYIGENSGTNLVLGNTLCPQNNKYPYVSTYCYKLLETKDRYCNLYLEVHKYDEYGLPIDASCGRLSKCKIFSKIYSCHYSRGFLVPFGNEYVAVGYVNQYRGTITVRYSVADAYEGTIVQEPTTITIKLPEGFSLLNIFRNWVDAWGDWFDPRVGKIITFEMSGNNSLFLTYVFGREWYRPPTTSKYTIELKCTQ